jgi:hypothetical protein
LSKGVGGSFFGGGVGCAGGVGWEGGVGCAGGVGSGLSKGVGGSFFGGVGGLPCIGTAGGEAVSSGEVRDGCAVAAGAASRQTTTSK